MAALTGEEKRGLVHSALDKYQQAQALVDQANKMMEKCGVKMCGVTVFGDAYEEETMQNLHVFSGIKKLAKLFDEETRNPLDIFIYLIITILNIINTTSFNILLIKRKTKWLY